MKNNLVIELIIVGLVSTMMVSPSALASAQDPLGGSLNVENSFVASIDNNPYIFTTEFTDFTLVEPSSKYDPFRVDVSFDWNIHDAPYQYKLYVELSVEITCTVPDTDTYTWIYEYTTYSYSGGSEPGEIDSYSGNFYWDFSQGYPNRFEIRSESIIYFEIYEWDIVNEEWDFVTYGSNNDEEYTDFWLSSEDPQPNPE